VIRRHGVAVGAGLPKSGTPPGCANPPTRFPGGHSPSAPKDHRLRLLRYLHGTTTEALRCRSHGERSTWEHYRSATVETTVGTPCLLARGSVLPAHPAILTFEKGLVAEPLLGGLNRSGMGAYFWSPIRVR